MAAGWRKKFESLLGAKSEGVDIDLPHALPFFGITRADG